MEKRGRKLIWTIEACKTDALRFSSKSHWYRESRGAYNAALRYGIVNECFGETEDRISITLEGIEYESVNAAFIAFGYCKTAAEVGKKVGGNVKKKMKLHGITREEAVMMIINADRRGSREEQSIAKAASEAARREEVERNRLEREKISYPNWWLKSFKTPVRTCNCCGKYMRATRGAKVCSTECWKEQRKVQARNQRKKLKAEGRRDNKHHHRARRHGVPYVPGITWKSVALQRGMRCMVCGTMCTKPNGKRVLKEATLGHIVALSQGGSHTYDNVQIECRSCNEAKGTTTYGQLVML